MQNLRCHVTGSTSTKTVAPAKPPAYCGDGKTPCVLGAKQMIAWNRTYMAPLVFFGLPRRVTLTSKPEADGNNVEVPDGISPGYNQKMGWTPGAQNDIFQ